MGDSSGSSCRRGNGSTIAAVAVATAATAIAVVAAIRAVATAIAVVGTQHIACITQHTTQSSQHAACRTPIKLAQTQHVASIKLAQTQHETPIELSQAQCEARKTFYNTILPQMSRNRDFGSCQASALNSPDRPLLNLVNSHLARPLYIQ